MIKYITIALILSGCLLRNEVTVSVFTPIDIKGNWYRTTDSTKIFIDSFKCERIKNEIESGVLYYDNNFDDYEATQDTLKIGEEKVSYIR
jgi:hypothetical protein